MSLPAITSALVSRWISRMHCSKFSCGLLWVPVLLAGCSSSTGPDGPPPPKTSPVSGVILIDGKPPELMTAVELKLYPKGRKIKPDDRVPKCTAGLDGKYTFSSYRDGDGAEPGEYVLSVEMLRRAPGAVFGPDQLGNNFNSPDNEDPRFQVTVVDGQPTEIPTIDISTKELKKQPRHPFASPPGKR